MRTAQLDWGDGTSAEPAGVIETPTGPPGDTAGATGYLVGSHVYANDGAYDLTATVSDDDGAGGVTP